MAKDPAFLFYPGDFSTGTQFFNNEQVGKYIRLLMAQHQHGHLTEEQMIFICKEKDIDVWSKFEIDSDGKMFNRRLDEEKNKRQAFSESRKANRNKANNDSLSIYLILNPHTGLVKIGSSVDVNRRLLELRRQYNNDLKILFVSVKYPQTKERDLHIKYKSKNANNEWFELSETDILDIKADLNNHMIRDISIHMDAHMENENENENENCITYGSKGELRISVKKVYAGDKMKVIYDLREYFKPQLDQFSRSGWTKFIDFMRDNPGRVFDDDNHVYNAFKQFHLNGKKEVKNRGKIQ